MSFSFGLEGDLRNKKDDQIRRDPPRMTEELTSEQKQRGGDAANLTNRNGVSHVKNSTNHDPPKDVRQGPLPSECMLTWYLCSS